MNLDYNEVNEFKRKMNNAKWAIKILREKGLISVPHESRLLVQSWKVKTMEELDNLTSELAEICKRK